MLPIESLLILFAGVLTSVIGMFLIRRFIPGEKLSKNNEFVGFTFSILSLIYGIYLAFTVVVVWQQFEDAEEKVIREVVLLNSLWRNAEPLPVEQRTRIRQHLIEYIRDVVHDDYPKMAHGMRYASSASYDRLWVDYYNFNPASDDVRQVTFYQEGVARLNEFAIARRLRILASNASLPRSMWILLLAGAAGTIMFTWFYGTHYLSLKLAATAFLSAVIIYGVLLVGVLEYPFGGAVRVTDDPFKDLLTTFEKRMK